MEIDKRCMNFFLDTLQQLLLKKGASSVLVECLRGYIYDKVTNMDVVECGCRALKGILMYRYVIVLTVA